MKPNLGGGLEEVKMKIFVSRHLLASTDCVAGEFLPAGAVIHLVPALSFQTRHGKQMNSAFGSRAGIPFRNLNLDSTDGSVGQ